MEQCGGTVEQSWWDGVVEQWNIDGGTVEQWWKQWWNSETVIVEQWNSDDGTVEQ